MSTDTTATESLSRPIKIDCAFGILATVPFAAMVTSMIKAGELPPVLLLLLFSMILCATGATYWIHLRELPKWPRIALLILCAGVCCGVFMLVAIAVTPGLGLYAAPGVAFTITGFRARWYQRRLAAV